MQCILTSFKCCYSNRLKYRPFPIFDKYPISSHILVNFVTLSLQMFWPASLHLGYIINILFNFVTLSLQMFWPASLHLGYIITCSKLIPHEP